MNSTYQSFSNVTKSNEFAIVDYIPVPYSTRRSPRNGKLPISAQTFINEQNDPTYKASMEHARALLAKDYKEILPNNLSTMRLQKGMSQTSLASVIGTSQSHVAKIEAGLLDVKFSTAAKIADALAVSMDELRPLITISKSEIPEVTTVVSGS
jgi:ribosome-binding protein aMBF1 (putative translation factor)